MTHLNFLRASGAILFLLVFFATVNAQHTLSGQIFTKSAARSQPRFNVKLYPPKASRRPILITSSDGLGNFRFRVVPGSYLLELYLGNALVYQEVIKVHSDITHNIDLRNKQASSQRPPP